MNYRLRKDAFEHTFLKKNTAKQVGLNLDAKIKQKENLKMKTTDKEKINI